MITVDQFLEFEKKTNFPIIVLLSETKTFLRLNYPKIVDFYKGDSKSIDKENFEKLSDLISRTEKCIEIFNNNKKVFDGSQYWEILVSLEDLKLRFYTITNLSKFLRSSIIKTSTKSGYLVSVTLQDGQTLEDVSDRVLNDEDYDNNWVDIAMNNDLKEQDWDISGGKEILVRKRVFQSDLVTTFVDNTIGNKIYGRDFNSKIEFFEDDLLTLNEEETLNQSVETLSRLTKNDIPEERSIGMNSDIYKGTNYSQLNFPTIAKDLKKTFRSDDLFEDITILDISHEDGDIFIKFEVGTKIGDVLIKNITL